MYLQLFMLSLGALGTSATSSPTSNPTSVPTNVGPSLGPSASLSSTCKVFDSDCLNTEYCSGSYTDVTGICKPRNVIGAACGDNVMNGGSTCVEGLTCANEICSDGKRCKAGFKAYECEATEYCSGSSREFWGACKAQNKENDPCGDIVVNGGYSCDRTLNAIGNSLFCNSTINQCQEGTLCNPGSGLTGGGCTYPEIQYCSGSWDDTKGVCKFQNAVGSPCGDTVLLGGSSCFEVPGIAPTYCDSVTNTCLDGEEPPPCLLNSNCKDDGTEYCANIGWMTRCLTLKQEGEICGDAFALGSNSCTEGFFCETEAEPPTCIAGKTNKCGPGFSCPESMYCKDIAGINECRYKVEGGGSCDEGSSFTKDKEICVSGADCREEGDAKTCFKLLLAGETCDVTPNCDEDSELFCTKDIAAEDPKCQLTVAEGKACVQSNTLFGSNVECKSQLYCSAATGDTDGKCTPTKGEGADCTTGVECTFGCDDEKKTCFSLSGALLGALGAGVIAGIALGGLCCCGICVFIVYLVVGKKRSKGQNI